MEIKYRPINPNDIDRCAELAVDIWPVAALITEDGNTQDLMKAYVRLGLILSDYAEVCCSNDNVIGFLFGSTGKRLPSFNKRHEGLKLFWEFISGKYGKIRNRFKFLACFLLTQLKVEIMCNSFDSEVELFAVDKNYRGQGIGRSLLDNFINEVKKQGMSSVYLYTDIECNYTFYDKYGFKKYKDFYDHELSLLKNKKVTSFIYCLEV